MVMREKGRRSALPRLRIAASAAVLLALVAGTLFAGNPVADASARNLSLCQLLPALLRLKAGIAAGAGVALVVFPLLLALTLLFGRAYCSSLCPVGTLQDLVLFLRRRASGVRLSFRRPRLLLRSGVIVASIGLWLLGSSLLFVLLDPYSMMERPLSALAVSLAGRSAAPPSLSSLPGSSESQPLTPSPAGGGWAGLGAVLFSAALLLGVLLAAAMKGRIFCNTLCPAGALLAPLAHRSLLRVRLAPGICTSCGLCERVCPPRCIDSANKRIYAGSCVLCFNCLPACPQGALRYRWSRA